MPSRRKCAHTTKIERVPSYAVYHGEEDLDDRLSNDGTLDLSMKKIKMEPSDDNIELSGEGMYLGDENEVGDIDAGISGKVSGLSGEEVPEDIAPPSDQCEANGKTGADDTVIADKPAGSHSSKQTPASASEGNSEEQIVINCNGQPLSPVTGLPLFPQSKGKSTRPFKLYTSNRDLLSGITTQGASSLATYSVPVALTPAVPGAVPITFASLPLVSGVPMIPTTTSPSTTTSASSSNASTGAGSTSSSTSSTSSTTTTVGAKTTSSTTDAHLMTLATEADKILRERHASEESSTGATSDMEATTGDTYSSSGGEETALLAGEVLKIPSLAGKSGNMNSLTFIQKRAVEAAQSVTNPPKNKKKRLALPDTLKDIAYWERRRKNNEAAKRSRDARRAKEDQIAIRAALLEQENMRLKIEVSALKEETAKLRSMLYANNNSHDDS
ncbi:serine-rich adhesin for platelets-like [Lytechinus variegatus]|uniref:serine-rich adhesin for platelets-like n=1 Tax=Lytechinus variegatus TaxID=7654 RepID=UPI001BB13AF7|nr:serine-rich adhesin for platelets-like [Lytechinus variegatus]XP_041467914.1 serine-rich adhesin for platelets-like [Lytechinus variegatus]